MSKRNSTQKALQQVEEEKKTTERNEKKREINYEMAFVKKIYIYESEKEGSHMNECSKMKPIHYKSIGDVTTG